MEIGPVIAGEAIGWRDLAAWQEITGIELEPWEARLIRRLSGAFLMQHHDAREHDCPAPFLGVDEVVMSNRERVAAQARAIFASRK